MKFFFFLNELNFRKKEQTSWMGFASTMAGIAAAITVKKKKKKNSEIFFLFIEISKDLSIC